MLLAEVVEVLGRVASTPSRSAKIAALAGLLRRLSTDEVEMAVAAVAGGPRQGKVGVGWATLMAIEPEPAADATLTLHDLDRTVAALQAVSGPGSALTRERLLADLFTRATSDEAFFIRRLLLGDLRQGALEGVVAGAVARVRRCAARRRAPGGHARR